MKNQLTFERLFILMAAVLFLTMICIDSFGQAKTPVKNIVIVHGAFADASGWEAVYKILKKDGYNVTLVQNPLTSLEDDVAAVNLALDKMDGPVVLVGHSWGGAVITQAGISPKVAGLVYVAAFVPEQGETAIGLLQSGPPLPVNGILPPDEKGIVYFDKAKFKECFAAEQTDDKASFMADSQQPIAVKSFLTPLTEAAWKSKPSYAIVATEDKSINPVLERTMYKRAGSVVTELKGSHTLYMSQAKAVAAVIENAAGHL
ncbi:hydrolase [Mucilaginibacter sp. PPCGB 2223]|uniref:alpha/beta hydrolase n=1 Tax=Mucilaginibacter sp. PPCGB 2223 TaxID=1886027 RepID=UPI0008264E16|nr:alpha/beta hydrolase [Mucilaginibacter sp. PPCGB 2223]OCX52126.1 hydrolase [Mucilaginibacter sp. PPCGB 2223]